jgi:hypothetical protein
LRNYNIAYEYGQSNNATTAPAIRVKLRGARPPDVIAGVKLREAADGRRPRVKSAPPALELGGAVSLLDHPLAQARQRAVHALVQTPRLDRAETVRFKKKAIAVKITERGNTQDRAVLLFLFLYCCCRLTLTIGSQRRSSSLRTSQAVSIARLSQLVYT